MISGPIGFYAKAEAYFVISKGRLYGIRFQPKRGADFGLIFRTRFVDFLDQMVGRIYPAFDPA